MSLIDNIAVLQKSVSELWKPTSICMNEELYERLNKEALYCTLYSSPPRNTWVKLSYVDGLEIVISSSLKENEVVFENNEGNFSKFVFREDYLREKPKRKGRYIRCER